MKCPHNIKINSEDPTEDYCANKCRWRCKPAGFHDFMERSQYIPEGGVKRGSGKAYRGGKKASCYSPKYTPPSAADMRDLLRQPELEVIIEKRASPLREEGVGMSRAERDMLNALASTGRDIEIIEGLAAWPYLPEKTPARP